MYYVYLLKSKNYNETYIGSTNDLRRRLLEHNNGMEISTKRYKPWRLTYYEAYQSEEDAREREVKLKHHGNAIRELKKRTIRSLKNGAGFTLIELVVVTGIIVLLTALTLPNYRSGNNQLALQRSAHKMAQDLRRVQEYAISAKEFEGAVPSGYGAYFDLDQPTLYILFADLDGGKDYDSGEEVEILNLEKGIKINSLLPNSPLTVVFSPPDPTIEFSPAASSAAVTIGGEGALQYSYSLSGTFPGAWSPLAGCDTSINTPDCPDSFSASASEPAIVYDRYKVGGAVQSKKYNKSGSVSTPQKTIQINQAGLIAVE